MDTAKRAARSRTHLDRRFLDLGQTDQLSAPTHGWIRAIRQALGMSTSQLAQRLRIKQPSVTALEQSEANGTIQLASLRRVAEALDCKLVYALVPNQPLDTVVKNRARAFAQKQLEPVAHSMALENQQVTAADTESRLEELVRETNPRRFWE
jgi:predicted DNA-binding mobile mystery protein A